MTPQELFENLCDLHPKKYDAASRVAWAMEYGRILGGIDGEVLLTAYEAAKKANKYAPTPNEILAHLPTPPPQVSENTYDQTFKFHDKADHLMRTDNGCKQAVKDGFGLGLYEFIAQHGRTPHIPEWNHIQETNTRFHEMYKACGTGQKLTFKTSQGERDLPVEGKWLPMFEQQIAKRSNIVERYG